MQSGREIIGRYHFALPILMTRIWPLIRSGIFVPRYRRALPFLMTRFRPLHSELTHGRYHFELRDLSSRASRVAPARRVWYINFSGEHGNGRYHFELRDLSSPGESGAAS